MKRSIPSGILKDTNNKCSKRTRQGEANSDTIHEEGPSCWNERLHRCFIEAIFENGMRHASPTSILNHMTNRSKALTNEKVKSHLQKFRKNKEKSIEEFMNEYDTWFPRLVSVGSMGSCDSMQLASVSSVLSMLGLTERPLGGGSAALLTYANMCEEKGTILDIIGKGDNDNESAPQKIKKLPLALQRKGSNECLKYVNGIEVPFPVFTREELQRPLGAAILQVISLFQTMTHYLLQERMKCKQNEMSIPRSKEA